MKKMMFTLFAMLTIAASASAMSYEQARNEALFLTDKMAYELNLTDAQYEAAYEINLDYLMGVTSQYDVLGPYWERRNLDLSYILFSWQWDVFRAATYFYRPLYWNAGYWHFGIYARYPHRDYFYFGRPHFYVSYRGGHSWRMNGGHSYYEGRRDFYRPSNRTRDQHFGMRNGWDRGDYRNNGGGHHSSTHITGGNPNGQRQPGGFGSNRGGNNNGGQPQGNYDRPQRNDGQPQGGFRSRSVGSGNDVIQRNANGETFGGSRTGSGTFGGSRMGGAVERGNGTLNQNGGSFNRSGGPVNRGTGSFNQGGGSRGAGSMNQGGGGTRSTGGTMTGGSRGGGSGSMGGGGGSRGGGSNSHGNFGGGRR